MNIPWPCWEEGHMRPLDIQMESSLMDHCACVCVLIICMQMFGEIETDRDVYFFTPCFF